MPVSEHEPTQRPPKESVDTTMPANTMEELVALCKRRGFVYPASEIYGGINGFWDYGPLGAQLKNNIREHWWKRMVECPPIGPDGHPLQIVGLDSAIIQNPKTWEASGHVGGFNDLMVDEKETNARYRLDHLIVAELIVVRGDKQESLGFVAAEQKTGTATDNWREEAERLIKRKGGCDNYYGKNLRNAADVPVDVLLSAYAPGSKIAGTLTEPKPFNLMFDSHAGPVKSDANKVYLRPETAQGIFLNYKNVLDTMRVKVPFGVAQIGKAFRNEVTPRNFIFRSREFEQMEMEWFCHPDEASTWYEFWKDARMKWWRSMGISESNLRFRDHDEDELAHYSKMCVDIEYKYPFTEPDFGELEGIAHRGCFDLTQHQEHSRQKMDYFDQELQVKLQNEGVEKDEINQRSRYVPNVIEPASGLTRGLLVLLCEAFAPTPDRKGSKYIMKFHPQFAPVKAGILPLVAKDGMPEIAEKLYDDLREEFILDLDVKQSIGKRYARQDEIGTPFCFTIDGQTKEDNTVTARDRDTLDQDRIDLSKVGQFLRERINGQKTD